MRLSKSLADITLCNPFWVAFSFKQKTTLVKANYGLRQAQAVIGLSRRVVLFMLYVLLFSKRRDRTFFPRDPIF